MLEAALAAVGDNPLAEAIRTSRFLYPIVNAAHILGLAALFGAVLALDLRLLGLMGSVPVRPLALALPRVAGAGLMLAVLTGALLFAVQPAHYAGNAVFLAKVAIVALGLAHVAYVHRTAAWRDVVAGGGDGDVSPDLRAAGAVSLVLWTAAIVAGRFIAFE